MMKLFKRKNSDIKLIKMANLNGQPIIKFRGVGCMSYDEFEWVGKVVGFEGDKVRIRIIKYSNSYGDIRDKHIRNQDIDDNNEEDYGIFKYPYMSSDIQCIDGVWVLYT